MQTIEVKIGDWISKGFDLYKANFATLLVAGIIAILLSVVTIGILGGPLMAGLIMMTLALIRKTEPKPGAGDVFKGFSVFLNAFLYAIAMALPMMILNFIPCVGPILGLAYGLGVGTLWMFALYLIADKNMAFWPACQASMEKVKSNFWPFLALWVVASVLGSIGAIACGIGMLVTLPVQFCIMSVAYEEIFNAPAPAAPAPTA